MDNPFLKKPWESDGHGVFIMCDGCPVVEMRGWGNLTSNAYGFTEEEATEIQQEVQSVIVEAVNQVIQKRVKLKDDAGEGMKTIIEIFKIIAVSVIVVSCFPFVVAILGLLLGVLSFPIWFELIKSLWGS